jgi:hypothetical protein
MTLKSILRSAQKFALENSPTILTVVGVVGTCTTAVLTGRAAYTSALLISEENEGRSLSVLDNRQKAQLVWKEFIPPAVVGAITLTAIIGANRIGTRRAAALAAAFSISEKMAEEYRQKVVEHIGAHKEEMVRSDVARERIQKADGVDTIILNDSEIVFYDSWSARAFNSTRERVEAAVNQVNHQILQNWSASLSEFYDLLGLEKTAVSDDFGWNTDEILEVYYTSCLLPNGKPACEIRYNTTPFQNFSRIG